MSSSNPFTLIEHINCAIVHPRNSITEFYSNELGCIPDPARAESQSLHMNCGPLTQFHLPTRKGEQTDAPVAWPGEIRVAYHPPKNTQVICDMYGTKVVQHVASEEEVTLLNRQRDGSLAPVVPGHPVGITSVVINCAPGSAAAIADFYCRVFQFSATIQPQADGNILASMKTTLGQSLVYREVESYQRHDVHAADAPHLAIYISNGIDVFRTCHQLGIAVVNPRFPHLDGGAVSEENTREFNQFRIVDITDRNGNVVHQMEHEIRIAGHPRFPKTTKQLEE